MLIIWYSLENPEKTAVEFCGASESLVISLYIRHSLSGRNILLRELFRNSVIFRKPESVSFTLERKSKNRFVQMIISRARKNHIHISENNSIYIYLIEIGFFV